MSVSIAALTQKNAARWAAMHVRPERVKELDAVAKRLCAPVAQARYQAISKAVWASPDRWQFVAVVHEREASQKFDRQLAQGDRLDQVSHNDPASRGPFFNHPADPPGQDAFYRGALDALVDCPPHASKWMDWSIGGMLTLLEEYNGLGYAGMGVPSAYVWSGSDQYESGKYVADHVYRASAVDVQEGCAPLLQRMALLDTKIVFPSVPPPVMKPPEKLPPPPPPGAPPEPLWLRAMRELAHPLGV